jgi:PAS domain S-box-containing protein
MTTGERADASSLGVEDALRRQVAQLEPILDLSPIPIVVNDVAGNVVAWNAAAERLFGYTAGEAVGQNLDDLVARTEKLHSDAVAYTARASKERGDVHPTQRTRKDGTLVDVEVLGAPLVVDGRRVGTLGMYHDITELNRQRRFLEALLEVSPEAIVTANLDDTVASWNPAAERLFGFTAEEAIGKDIDDLVARRPDLYAEGKELNRGALVSPMAHLVTQRTRKDGTLVDVDIVGGPVRVGGEIVAKHVFYHDITELQQQKRYFESLLEISPAAIIVTNLESKVVSWNPAAERLFGYSADEAVGQPLDDLVATRPELLEEALANSRQAASGERVEFTGRRTRKDGSVIDVHAVSEPVVVGEERIGFVVIYHDITELQQQTRYFESLLETSPVAIVITDLDSTVVSWNPAAERLFGYSAQEAVGRKTDELVAGVSEFQDEARAFTEASARGERVHAITRRARKDGSVVDVELIIVPVRVGGEQVGAYVLYHDITELQQQRRYYETLLEVVPTAIVGISPEGDVTSWNPAAQRLFDYATEEAVGRNIDDLVAKGEGMREEAQENTRLLTWGSKTQWLARRTRKDGSLVDVQVTGAPIRVGGQLVEAYLIFHDVTELQQQRRYYEALAQFSPVAIALLDRTGMITSWNPAAEQLFGYSAEEAIGRNIDNLVADSDDIRAESEAYTARGLSGEFEHAFTRRTRKDGAFVDVEMFAAPVTVAGDIAGFYAMYHDVRELQQARRDAEVATEAKSAFLATMSHEIRTPLNAVIGMTGLLLDTTLTAEQRNFAEVIRSSGDALLGVINDILDFSKIEAGRLDLENAPFDLRACVESALELVAAGALRKGLDLAFDLDPAVPGALVGDETRLRQILINLLNNAVKFTEQGEVVVTADSVPLGEDRHRLHFAVRDTGIGIPDDRRGRLFESFSQVDPSTTRRYGGTGLGLAISRRLVELMDGTMWVESEPGRGSTFHFTIQASASETPPRAYERSGPPQLAGRRVLIVDDNATNRRILTRQAESWDMIPSAAESPAEALSWIRRGDPFDVAILDMQMPEMDGVTLAREIRGHRDATSLPLVMLTSLGRLDEPAREFAAFLTKPIKPSHLYDALLSVFGHRAEVVGPVVVDRAHDEHLAERLPLRILVVEDNAVNQQLALLLLQKLGYRADVAGNGVEALGALERQPYDVVLMDVEMPEMDGLEATRRIHLRWADTRPHIVAVTANALPGERELCLRAGMDDYLTKPIRMEELTAALGRGSPRGALAPPPGTRSVDPDVVHRLAASLGEDGGATVAALIDTFVAGVPGQVAALRSAAELGDGEVVRRVAHTLKSNAATFGASALEVHCRELEAAAKAGELGSNRDRLSRVEEELGRVSTELGDLRTELRR